MGLCYGIGGPRRSWGAQPVWRVSGIVIYLFVQLQVIGRLGVYATWIIICFNKLFRRRSAASDDGVERNTYATFVALFSYGQERDFRVSQNG